MPIPYPIFRSPYVYTGTSGDDALYSRYATAVNESFYGYEGNDYIDGGLGADRMFGGAGHDTYIVDNAGDAVFEDADEGFDTVRVSFSYTIPLNVERLELTGTAAINATGSSLDDRLYGNASSNILWGGAGNDILNGQGGTDTAIGGTGNDTYYVDNAGDVVVEYANEGIDWVATTFSYTLGHNLENASLLVAGAMDLIGNELDNALHGNGYTNVLSGGVGNDRLYAGNGDDQLLGGDGNDFLDGDWGVDIMSGGAGNDIYLVDNANDVVAESIGQGVDEVRTSVSYVLTAGAQVEIFVTTDNAGTAAIDLVGNEFNNTIVGNDGVNTIVGSPGNDGGGYDGLDVLTGRGGGDTFVWSSTAETTLAGQEADVVTDFNRSQGDLLAFNLIDANVTNGGQVNDAFTFVGVVNVSVGESFTAPGQIGFFTTATDTYILLNTDTDGFQEATIRLVGAHNVDASWFVL
jgi:Ca2+-binding RTX toxin-like protein